MSDQQKLIAQLQLIIQKANRSLVAAKRHIEEDDYDFASSRAYYALFYGMQAALLTKNLTASSHAGTIHLFNQHFIKTAIFPKEFSKSISRLFRARQTGDYTFEVSIAEIDARQDLQTAENLLRAITTYLNKQGLLPVD